MNRGRAAAGLLGACLLVVATLSGCPQPAERFPARGVVRGVDVEGRQVLIDHDEIEGLMPAMTMSFDVDRRALLEGLGAGHEVEFVVVSDGRGFRIAELVVTGSTYEEAQGPGLADLARVGDRAPDFELIDQAGDGVSLASLRGRPVLLDFVFTHCPGPCPILTAKHAGLQRRLSPEQRERTRFVSISLDPERDSPEALRDYASSHGADLDGWSFLTGPPEEVRAVLSRYGVGTGRDENGEIEHVVVTFLIGSDGRIARRYLGLEHGTEEMLADLGAL